MRKRTLDKDTDFWEGFGDVQDVLSAGDLDSFEFRFHEDDEETLRPRIEEWINHWGRGRGIKFLRHEVSGTKHHSEITYESYFTPAFETSEQLLQALEDEDGIV